MKEKRNIDQLFQGKFEGFEANPSPEVWDRIKAKLQEEKEDRKVIPIWWKLGGVAALLALLLSVGSLFYDGNQDNDVVVDGDLEKQKELLKEKDTETSPTHDALVKDETSTQQDNIPDKSKGDAKKTKLTDVIPSKESIAEENLSDSKKDIKKAPISKDNYSIKESIAVKENPSASQNKKTKTANIDLNKNPKTTIRTEEKVIAKAESKNKTSRGIKEISQNKEAPLNKAIPQNSKNSSIVMEETAISKEEINDEKLETPSEEKKKSIFDAIEENKEAVAIQQPDSKNSSWEVAPNVGPVYYNSLSGGSSIDPSFADNTQEGNVNFSYGVQVAYNINDKFSIRTGVNNVSVGYNTGEVEIVTGPQSYALKAVDYNNPQGRVLTAVDKGTLSNAQGNGNPYDQLVLKSTSSTAELTQNISYFEIPLELKYNLLNKKFGINMIGGFSTLLLGNNEIVVNDENFRGVLGEANNLNNVSFSTNIGLGLDYKISKRLKFNIEPMFKYQLNPYSDSSVNFHPYYLGIYSGFSFKF